jgi:polar amino acid transport system permease protein
MNALAEQFFNFEIMRQAMPLLLTGLGMTAVLCLVVVPLGFVGGVLTATLSLSSLAPVRWANRIYIDIFRALPPVVLLILVYSGLPFVGLRPGPFTAVCIAFFLNTSSYFGEIVRAGVESVGRGQWEAARSTGLGWTQAYRDIVLPQALRNVLPDLASNTIEVVKLTSIASVVSLPELLYSADMARSVTFNASPVVLAGLIYLAFLWPAVRLVGRLENRVAQ